VRNWCAQIEREGVRERERERERESEVAGFRNDYFIPLKSIDSLYIPIVTRLRFATLETSPAWKKIIATSTIIYTVI